MDQYKSPALAALKRKPAKPDMSLSNKPMGPKPANAIKPIDLATFGAKPTAPKPENVMKPIPVGGRRHTLKRKFTRCVKSVRKTIRARKGSTKESAAIAICTKSVLQTRGRTIKRYTRKRLVTQKKFRGGLTIPGLPKPVGGPMTPGDFKKWSEQSTQKAMEAWQTKYNAEKANYMKTLRSTQVFDKTNTDNHVAAHMAKWTSANPKPA